MMVRREQGTALRQVQMLFQVGTIGSLSDRQLLEQFQSRAGDAAEAAFAGLVERHGPMVIRTCRSVLRDEHAVEDAFQATFLVLVRRARSLWVRDSLGPWLFQVAVRVSASARASDIRRRRLELKKARQTDLSVFDRDRDNLSPLIHQELARLPEQFRAAVVLCCLEGLSQQQAARQLGWPLGTLQSRLARGREQLRAKLMRRGIAPSGALLAALLSSESAHAALPAALASSTVRMAAQYVSGKAGAAVATASPVILLTQGVLKTMILQKLKLALALILVVAMTAASAVVCAHQAAQVESGLQSELVTPTTAEEEDPFPTEVEPNLFFEGDHDDDELAETQKSDSHKPEKVIDASLGDGKPDGKQSLGGSGEMIELKMPDGASKVLGVKIHGSRYGLPQAPKESFLIYFLNKDRTRILHTEMAPYSLFKRGAEDWVEARFESPIAGLPKSFWITLDFRAEQTKGVYVSFDTTTGGKFSRIGLPGLPSKAVNFGGDWMIQAIFAE
jgi:RNA polymerase sigma factor (sigma-70 family)